MTTIKDFKDKHVKDTCFVLGNGPSLKHADRSFWKYLHTFGTNRCYLLDGFTPDYYVCVNPLVLEQYHDEIAELDTIKFIPEHVSFDNKNGEVIRIDTSEGMPGFYSPEEPMWEGHTVTYVCLQIAYYMGFETVILDGIDHYYGQVMRPNLEAIATGPDEHHFSAEYFSDGARWNLPDLARSEIAYSLAKQAYEADGRSIYNESSNSALELFDPEYNSVRVSAIVSAYKAEDYLQGCLDDLHNQDEPTEIIVICQEGSEEHEIATHNGDIRIITTKDIPTVYAAWNIGIKVASGKYITNANTDDRHHPKAYKLMADILDAREDIDLVYHDCYITWKPGQSFDDFVKENGEKELVPGRFEGKPGFFHWRDYDREALGHGCFIGPQPMWRRRLHQRYGYFAENMQVAGDYEYWLRISKDRNFLHLPYFLGLYAASMQGMELAHPIETADETAAAMYLHQCPDGAGYAIAGEYVRLDLGGKWVYAQRDEFKELVGKLLKELG